MSARARLLDVLRVAFPYIVAFCLPLAGLVIAVVKFVEGDHVSGLRIGALAVLGGSLLLLFVY